jgi:hypothetical protein
MSRVSVISWFTLVLSSIQTFAFAEPTPGPFSKLGFLNGKWGADVRVTDKGVAVMDLTFDTILSGKFLQLNYTVKKGDSTKAHHVIVGAGSEGKLRGWTFTSDGKVIESTVEVEPQKNGCAVTVITGKNKVIARFTKTADKTFDVEYGNPALNRSKILTTFRKKE